MHLLLGLMLLVVAAAGVGDPVSVVAPGRVVIKTSVYDDVWKEGGRAPGAAAVAFKIALKQRNLDRLEQVFWRVSDPNHEDYGRYLTREEVLSMIGPADNERQRVRDWLVENGVSRFVDNGDVFDVECSVAQVEALTEARMYVYRHVAHEGAVVLRAMEHVVPAGLTSVVESFPGLDSFPLKMKKRTVIGVDKPLDGHLYSYPEVLRNLYGVDAAKDRITTPKATQAVAQFVSVFSSAGFSEPNLQEFYTATGEFPTKVTKITKNGSPSVEGTLDIEYISSIGSNGSSQFWVTSGDFYDNAVSVFNEPAATRPLINSISFGVDETQYGKEKCSRLDAEYMKLGTIGTTVLAASGDDGASGDEVCMGPNVLGGGGYPAASPYVVSVGATQMDHAKQQSNSTPGQPPICSQVNFCAHAQKSELVCSAETGSLITTGGGFSFYAQQPAYQKEAVDGYFNSGVSVPECGSACYTKTNRGYPDISANGDYFLIRYTYKGKDWASSSGTSCSTPVIGGLFSLFNSKLLSKGKPPLGFVTPLLYTMAKEQPNTFTDITLGNNAWSRLEKCKYGWQATKGWDPASGLGTPDFPNMVAYLEKKGIL